MKNVEELSCQVLSPLKMSETELELMPQLCPDQAGLDAHGIQSLSLITNNLGDSQLKISASFIYTTTMSICCGNVNYCIFMIFSCPAD